MEDQESFELLNTKNMNKPLEINFSYERRVKSARDKIAKLLIEQEEVFQELICRIGIEDGSQDSFQLFDYLANDYEDAVIFVNEEDNDINSQ